MFTPIQPLLIYRCSHWTFVHCRWMFPPSISFMLSPIQPSWFLRFNRCWLSTFVHWCWLFPLGSDSSSGHSSSGLLERRPRSERVPLISHVSRILSYDNDDDDFTMVKRVVGCCYCCCWLFVVVDFCATQVDQQLRRRIVACLLHGMCKSTSDIAGHLEYRWVEIAPCYNWFISTLLSSLLTCAVWLVLKTLRLFMWRWATPTPTRSRSSIVSASTRRKSLPACDAWYVALCDGFWLLLWLLRKWRLFWYIFHCIWVGF